MIMQVSRTDLTLFIISSICLLVAVAIFLISILPARAQLETAGTGTPPVIIDERDLPLPEMSGDILLETAIKNQGQLEVLDVLISKYAQKADRCAR